MINPGISGKTAIVTGVNNPRGIGASIAAALAAQGVRVFATYYRAPVPERLQDVDTSQPGEAMYLHSNSQDARTVQDRIRAEGGAFEAVEADLSDPAAAPEIFAQAEAAFGPVSILVNNAAHSEASTFLPDASAAGETYHWGTALPTISAASHDRSFAVNTRAPGLLMAEFARRHTAHGADWGRVVNISTDGSAAFAREVDYGASKHALEAYSRAAAKELGRFGITVNIIAPGPTQTGWLTAEMVQPLADNTPLGRIGYPDDIADAVVFLVSQQARWVTGQLIYVGGGHRM